MKNYIIFILCHRIAVIAVISILTIAFGIIASMGIYSSAISKLFFEENHPGFKRYQERIREFANDEMVIVIYKDLRPFSEASLARLKKVVAEIESFPEIRRVDSLLNAQHTYSKGNTLYIKKYVNEAREGLQETEQVLRIIREDSMYSRLVISEDGQHAAVIVELEPVDELAGEKVPPLVNAIMRIFKQAGYKAENLHRVGFTSSMADVVSQMDFNIKKLFPLSCIILLLIVFLMFYRLWPMFITLGVSLMGVIWTFGFAVLLDRQISIFISITPVVIMIVATSDIVHLCSAYLLELVKGNTKDDAILVSGTEVGIACFWTSVTTFVGFVSLSFVPIPMFKQMGLVLGFGVGASLLLAMTLTPILFSLMKQPDASTYDASTAQRMLSKMLSNMERHILRNPRLMVVLFMSVLAFSIYGAMNIKIDTDFYKRFKNDSRTRQDEAYYHRHFAGANLLEVFIDTPEADGVLEPNTFARVVAFQRGVEKLVEVDDALSLVNLIETIDREMNPEYGPQQTSVWTLPLLAQYLLLFESSGGEDLDRVVDFERRTLRMNIRLNENSTQFTYTAGQKIERLAADILSDSAEVEVTGMMYLLGGFVDDVITGQKKGLIFAFFTIMIMMIIIFRSMKIGLWSMLPNALPLFVLGGYLGYFWHAVDSDTIIIAMVAIGIGVDDTIHFLSRLRFESSESSDSDKALQRAYHFSGRAMLTTTLILSAGFMPLGLSDYFTVRIFGTLLPMTLVVAVLGDLLLVPALVKLGAIRFSTATRKMTE